MTHDPTGGAATSPIFVLVRLTQGDHAAAIASICSSIAARDRSVFMTNDECARRQFLQTFAAVPVMTLVAQAGGAAAQTVPVKVDTKGLVAKIKFEATLAGFLNDLNGRYKLRVTELTLAPGGYVG